MKIHTIGGYSEVGKNMTAVELGKNKDSDDAIIFDMGLFLPAVVELEEKDRKKYSEKFLRSISALPDDLVLDHKGIRQKVRALLIGHAHLDHVFGVPFMEHRYNADIVGTKYTMAVLDTIVRDEKIMLRNKTKAVNPNSTFIIKGKNKDYQAEFINMTHSTPQTALIAVHTDEGAILYANDFKLDNNPVLGLTPNYAALKRIAKEGVKALVIDALYAKADGKTPSEKVARHMVEDVLLTPENKGYGMITTTFSSHIARLQSIVEYGRKLGREIVFIGRSLNKYTQAAKQIGICQFHNQVKILSYRKQIDSFLKKVNKNKDRYLLVCTGHQGEPGSVLDRLSRGVMSYKISPKDHIIFASNTIPTEVTIANRGVLMQRLKRAGARIFDNVHVSGHGWREDLHDLITITQPEHIIPSHGSLKQVSPLIDLASDLGYKFKKNSHIMADGEHIVFE